MKWRRPRSSTGVEDRRRAGSRRGMPLPSGRGAAGGLGGLGVLGLILVLILGGGNILGGGADGFEIGLEPFPAAPDAVAEGEPLPGAPPADDRLAQFATFVLQNVQESWAEQFASAGERYPPTTLVLFRGRTVSGCGQASAATGPFYCTLDRKVYLDLSFFRELERRFRAPGDFAQAYVIAHEVGHHVQNVLGVSEEVNRVRRTDPGAARELSIRLELQADCLAGVWAHTVYRDDLLDPGDIDEGLGAAAAVGDDRIQASTTGRIDPESWTHGSAEQRTTWFRRGFDAGDLNACDTFAGDI